MSDKPVYFPSIKLEELSCAPTRDIKLRFGWFNGGVRVVVYNSTSGGISKPIWEAKLRPLEMLTVFKAMHRVLNDRIVKNPNNNTDVSFVLTAYNPEAQNKRAPVGEIALVYSAESKKIALRIHGKHVDGQLFPLYPSSNVDMSNALSYTDAGGKAEALFVWVSAWLTLSMDRITQLSIENDVFNGMHPRPRPNGGGGKYNGGGGYSGNNNGGSRGSGGMTDTDLDLEDDIPF